MLMNEGQVQLGMFVYEIVECDKCKKFGSQPLLQSLASLQRTIFDYQPSRYEDQQLFKLLQSQGITGLSIKNNGSELKQRIDYGD